MSSVTHRLTGALPVLSATDAAGFIQSGDTVLTSGFGSLGYPKEVPIILVEGERDLSLTLPNRELPTTADSPPSKGRRRSSTRARTLTTGRRSVPISTARRGGHMLHDFESAFETYLE